MTLPLPFDWDDVLQIAFLHRTHYIVDKTRVEKVHESGLIFNLFGERVFIPWGAISSITLKDKKVE